MGRRIALVVAVVDLLLASTVVGHRALTTSTPLSAQEVVRDFRAGAEGSALAAAGRSSADGPASPPAEGVYVWRTDGWEDAGGLRRELPARSFRVVSRTGPASWTARHLYSREHDESFELAVGRQGAFSSSHAVRVALGPFSEQRTFGFEPPLPVCVYPLEVGRRWEGEWNGATAGSYLGAIVDRSTTRVGGRRTDVVTVRLRLTLRGDLTGTVDVVHRLAPLHRMTVAESYRYDVAAGSRSYRAAWTITLEDLEPRV